MNALTDKATAICDTYERSAEELSLSVLKTRVAAAWIWTQPSACNVFVGLFVCLGFSSHSRIFHSFGDVTNTGEGLQMLTYSLHLWPMSSKGSLKCHTYCDTDLLFIMVIPKDPHSHLLPSVWQWRYHYPFLQCRSVPTRDRSPFSRLRGKRSSTEPQRQSHSRWTL